MGPLFGKIQRQCFCLLLLWLLFIGLKAQSQNIPNQKILSKEAYKEAVYASWIGQIVGNTYGLCYEFVYIEEPGPDIFPYKYTWTLDSLKKYNGAFSDDDTDIEFMYLTQMEKHGIEPSYFQLAEAWKRHVKTKVWCANRAALTLMKAGHYPPLTGSKKYNPLWCQIDPQLVNEIWAVTAPCMVNYAVRKSEFAARITNDSFGIEPTLHYAAMYSAAFYEHDINKLIEIGTAALSPNARFGQIVNHVKQLVTLYPSDWKSARKIIKESYFKKTDYNKNAWPVIDANLNGALGIMALIYGKGDFQKTLDYCCAFGMDADNQAATMCGLLGIVNGLKEIPENLMYPITGANWRQPFNNSYRMVTREGLSDAKLTEIAERMALQGEKVILAQGGKKFTKNGKEYYSINTAAKFIPPFELNPIPPLHWEVNKPSEYPIYTGANPKEIQINLAGIVPAGIALSNGLLKGIPTQPGHYTFNIQATHQGQTKSIELNITIHTTNLSTSANQILYNPHALDHQIEKLRDGNEDETYYSTKIGETKEIDYYGYTWTQKEKISAIQFNIGAPLEYCGWFTTMEVEYLKDNQWVKMNQTSTTPKMDLENTQWLKPNFINYTIQFPTVTTQGIRIIGMPGGLPKDATNAHLGLQFYSAISELRVYKE